MTLDPQALQTAENVFANLLRKEADQQHAYIFQFPDGRISIELEWIDAGAIAREVVIAYLAHLRDSEVPSTGPGGLTERTQI